jgi:hypothetical protein
MENIFQFQQLITRAGRCTINCSSSHVISKYVFCDSSVLIILDVHLLATKVHNISL